MEYESSNKTKIQELNERLRHVDRKTDDDYDSRYMYLQNKLLTLEDKFKKAAMTEDSKLRSIESDLHKLEEQAKHDKREFETTLERKQGDLSSLEKTLGHDLQELSTEMRELRVKLIKGIDEKGRAVKQECSDNVAEFKNETQARCGEIAQRLQQIRDVIDSQRKVRDETSEFLIRSFGEEILKLQEMLNTEKNNRIKPNREAFQLIDEMVNVLNDQLVDEKREKQRAQQLFTRLLEQTCIKIENSFLN